MDAVLRTAADGLRFFATFVPRAAFVAERAGTGDTFPTYDEIEARYFEQGDIRLDALAADIDVVTRAVEDIDGRCSDHERIRSAVARSWQGPAADSADAHFAEHLKRAARSKQDLGDVRCALVEADRALRDVAARKADWVASLDPVRVCGRTVAEVDEIVATAVNFGSAADDAANWAVDVFLARVRETTTQFAELCDRAESSVDDVFRNLDAAFCAVDDSDFRPPARIEAVEVCSDGRTAMPTSPCPQPPSGPATAPACTGAAAAPPPAGSLAGLTCTNVGTSAAQASGTAPPPVPLLPPAPTSGVTVGSVGSGASAGTSGSLAIEGAVRAAGAIVGAVAEVALGIVGDIVVEVTEAVRETGSLNMEPGPDTGCACDCECSCAAASSEPRSEPEPQPEPQPAAPDTEPDPEPAPVAVVPEPEPEAEPECPAPEFPEPAAPVEPPEASVSEPPAPADSPAPADYCAPPEEARPEEAPAAQPPAEHTPSASPGAIGPGAGSNPVRGTRTPADAASPVVAGTVDPTLAEAGPQEPGADDREVALAEAGGM